jgi:hypothetical protein
LLTRFGFTVSSIRTFAEQIAYCMASQSGLGLSPARTDLIAGMRRAGLTFDGRMTAALDALEFLRLARATEIMATGANAA